MALNESIILCKFYNNQEKSCGLGFNDYLDLSCFDCIYTKENGKLVQIKVHRKIKTHLKRRFPKKPGKRICRLKCNIYKENGTLEEKENYYRMAEKRGFEVIRSKGEVKLIKKSCIKSEPKIHYNVESWL